MFWLYTGIILQHILVGIQKINTVKSS